MTQLALFGRVDTSIKRPRPPRPASWMDEVGPEDYDLHARMKYVLTFWTPKTEDEWLAWAPHLLGPLPDRWERYRATFIDG